MDKCSAFREGAARAKQVGEEARRKQMADAAEWEGVIWRHGRNTGLWIGALLGGAVAISIMLVLMRGAWPRHWQSIHEHQPEVRKQVVVTTHDRWTIGYFDEGHDFRDANTGEIVRGAYWWYELPERP